jgi:hypothetical protein
MADSDDVFSDLPPGIHTSTGKPAEHADGERMSCKCAKHPKYLVNGAPIELYPCWNDADQEDGLCETCRPRCILGDPPPPDSMCDIGGNCFGQSRCALVKHGDIQFHAKYKWGGAKLSFFNDDPEPPNYYQDPPTGPGCSCCTCVQLYRQSSQ